MQVNDPISGTYAIKKAKEKAGKLFNFLNLDEQKRARELFFAKRDNQLFKEGSYCMCDIEFSKKIIKGASGKRALICQIKDIDFRQEPPLFILQSAFEKKLLPIKYYQSQLKPLFGDPSKIDSKFKKIVAQRESRNSALEVKVNQLDGTQKWVRIASITTIDMIIFNFDSSLK